MSQLTIVKEWKGQGAMLKDSKGEILFRLDNVRLSHPYLGTPSEDEDENGNKKKSWRTVSMLPKKTHVQIKDALKEHIQNLMKENETRVPASNWFLTNGDEKDDENLHGHFLITAGDSTKRPKVRDQRGHVMDDIAAIDDKFYGGCWASVLIRPWYFNGRAKNGRTYPKRIPANLVGVMFLKDDTPFGKGRIDDDGVWGEPQTNDDDGMGDDDDDSGL